MIKHLSRYLDRQRFDWLLSDQGLYFSSAFNQTDDTEGVYDHTFLSRMIADQIGISSPILKDIDKLQLGLQNHGRFNNFLSCWFIGTEESQEMWDTFGTDGVVILSDEFLLSNALPEPLNQATAFYEAIYDDELKRLSPNEPLRFIDSIYGTEKEFRIVFDLTKYSILTGFEAQTEVLIGGVPSHLSSEITSCMSREALAKSHEVIRKKDKGFVVEYDLNSIITEIRVNPNATDEELRETRHRLRESGINCKVNHSSLRSANS
jgi:hypothetical protein